MQHVELVALHGSLNRAYIDRLVIGLSLTFLLQLLTLLALLWNQTPALSHAVWLRILQIASTHHEGEFVFGFFDICVLLLEVFEQGLDGSRLFLFLEVWHGLRLFDFRKVDWIGFDALTHLELELAGEELVDVAAFFDVDCDAGLVLDEDFFDDAEREHFYDDAPDL